MKGEGTDANEARVREVWEKVHTGEVALHLSAHSSPIVIRNGGEFANWSAAAAYTEQVIEEARQLLREMHHIECLSGRPPESLIREAVEEAWPDSMTNDYVREICAYSRILARLESIYAAHIRGINPEALERMGQ